jgi:hypothetical protein
MIYTTQDRIISLAPFVSVIARAMAILVNLAGCLWFDQTDQSGLVVVMFTGI